MNTSVIIKLILDREGGWGSMPLPDNTNVKELLEKARHEPYIGYIRVSDDRISFIRITDNAKKG